MLTHKTRYAIFAMTKLARENEQGNLQINQIAESENIPKRFLESILLELKKNGFLGSKLGKHGGYFLVKKPEEIKLLEIVRLFEGTIALLPCTSEKYYEPCVQCKDEQTCAIRSVFYDIRQYTYNKLSSTTLASLVR